MHLQLLYMYMYIPPVTVHVHVPVQGLVKPDIVFFGEDLPQRFHSLQLPDFAKCDLLIVMGTSLEVYRPCKIPLQLVDTYVVL